MTTGKMCLLMVTVTWVMVSLVTSAPPTVESSTECAEGAESFVQDYNSRHGSRFHVESVTLCQGLANGIHMMNLVIKDEDTGRRLFCPQVVMDNGMVRRSSECLWD